MELLGRFQEGLEHLGIVGHSLTLQRTMWNFGFPQEDVFSF